MSIDGKEYFAELSSATISGATSIDDSWKVEEIFFNHERKFVGINFSSPIKQISQAEFSQLIDNGEFAIQVDGLTIDNSHINYVTIPDPEFLQPGSDNSDVQDVVYDFDVQSGSYYLDIIFDTHLSGSSGASINSDAFSICSDQPNISPPNVVSAFYVDSYSNLGLRLILDNMLSVDSQENLSIEYTGSLDLRIKDEEKYFGQPLDDLGDKPLGGFNIPIPGFNKSSLNYLDLEIDQLVSSDAEGWMDIQLNDSVTWNDDSEVKVAYSGDSLIIAGTDQPIEGFDLFANYESENDLSDSDFYDSIPVRSTSGWSESSGQSITIEFDQSIALENGDDLFSLINNNSLSVYIDGEQLNSTEISNIYFGNPSYDASGGTTDGSGYDPYGGGSAGAGDSGYDPYGGGSAGAGDSGYDPYGGGSAGAGDSGYDPYGGGSAGAGDSGYDPYGGGSAGAGDSGYDPYGGGSAGAGDSGYDPYGGASADGSGYDPYGGASADGSGYDPYGGASADGSGYDPYGGASADGSGYDPYGGASADGSGYDPYGGASADGSGYDPYGGASAGGTAADPYFSQVQLEYGNGSTSIRLTVSEQFDESSFWTNKEAISSYFSVNINGQDIPINDVYPMGDVVSLFLSNADYVNPATDNIQVSYNPPGGDQAGGVIETFNGTDFAAFDLTLDQTGMASNDVSGGMTDGSGIASGPSCFTIEFSDSALLKQGQTVFVSYDGGGGLVDSNENSINSFSQIVNNSSTVYNDETAPTLMAAPMPSLNADGQTISLQFSESIDQSSVYNALQNFKLFVDGVEQTGSFSLESDASGGMTDGSGYDPYGGASADGSGNSSPSSFTLRFNGTTIESGQKRSPLLRQYRYRLHRLWHHRSSR